MHSMHGILPSWWPAVEHMRKSIRSACTAPAADLLLSKVHCWQPYFGAGLIGCESPSACLFLAEFSQQASRLLTVNGSESVLSENCSVCCGGQRGSVEWQPGHVS